MGRGCRNSSAIDPCRTGPGCGGSPSSAYVVATIPSRGPEADRFPRARVFGLRWIDACLVDRLTARARAPAHMRFVDEERVRARAALDLIAAADRQMLELRYLEDLSFAEIAAKLDLGLSAVKMRHLRALARLRAAGRSAPEPNRDRIRRGAGQRGRTKTDGRSRIGLRRSQTGSAAANRSTRRSGRRAPRRRRMPSTAFSRVEAMACCGRWIPT